MGVYLTNERANCLIIRIDNPSIYNKYDNNIFFFFFFFFFLDLIMMFRKEMRIK